MPFIIHIVTSFGQLLTAPSDLCYLFINGIHASSFCVLRPAGVRVIYGIIIYNGRIQIAE